MTDFFENLFHGGFYLLRRVFSRNLLRGEFAEKIFFSVFYFDVWLGIRIRALRLIRKKHQTTALNWVLLGKLDLYAKFTVTRLKYLSFQNVPFLMNDRPSITIGPNILRISFLSNLFILSQYKQTRGERKLQLPQSSRQCIALFDMRPGFKYNIYNKTKLQKIFLRLHTLRRILAKTLAAI